MSSNRLRPSSTLAYFPLISRLMAQHLCTRIVMQYTRSVSSTAASAPTAAIAMMSGSDRCTTSVFVVVVVVILPVELD